MLEHFATCIIQHGGEELISGALCPIVELRNDIPNVIK